MKSSLFTLFFMVILVGKAADKGSLVFNDTICDLGTIEVESGYNTGYFHFTNQSDSTINILGALSACGCTIPTYPHETIRPGQGGTVSVTYDTMGRPDGSFDKTITLILSGNHHPVHLHLRGTAVKTRRKKEFWQ